MSNLGKFFSAFARPSLVCADPGTLTRPQYKDKVLENGAIGIEEVQPPIDLDALIQSDKESTLIYNILSRYQGGDLSALGDPHGVFADVRADQVSYIESLQRVLDLKNSFMSLPADFRAMFGNNIEQFVKELNSDKIDSKVSDFIKLHPDKFIAPKEETKVEEGDSK